MDLGPFIIKLNFHVTKNVIRPLHDKCDLDLDVEDEVCKSLGIGMRDKFLDIYTLTI